MPSAAMQRELMECSVCFEDLSSEPCAIFMSAGSRRVCLHVFHERCALELPSKHCPLCRADFVSVARLPSLATDAEAWFAAVDFEGDGRLSKAQVLQVMLTQFPLDVPKFEAKMDELWPTFDKTGSGYVSRAEFFAPGGLVHFARTNSKSLARGGAELSTEPAGPPDIRHDRHGWFGQFDEDATGELTQEEMVRALIKTYKLASDLGQVRAMRELVDAVWAVFASGATVTRDEFLQPDGLAEAIIAGLDPSMQAAPPGGGGGAPPPSQQLELPPNMKQCPACDVLLEKVGGDDTFTCGNCKHRFNFATLAPLGNGMPGAPANGRQVNFGGQSV